MAKSALYATFENVSFTDYGNSSRALAKIVRTASTTVFCDLDNRISDSQITATARIRVSANAQHLTHMRLRVTSRPQTRVGTIAVLTLPHCVPVILLLAAGSVRPTGRDLCTRVDIENAAQQPCERGSKATVALARQRDAACVPQHTYLLLLVLLLSRRR